MLRRVREIHPHGYQPFAPSWELHWLFLLFSHPLYSGRRQYSICICHCSSGGLRQKGIRAGKKKQMKKTRPHEALKNIKVMKNTRDCSYSGDENSRVFFSSEYSWPYSFLHCRGLSSLLTLLPLCCITFSPSSPILSLARPFHFFCFIYSDISNLQKLISTSNFLLKISISIPRSLWFFLRFSYLPARSTGYIWKALSAPCLSLFV